MAERNSDYRHLNPALAEYAALAPGGRRDRLRDLLVVGFLPVANHIARRYSGRGEPVDDLEQVARIGLVQALDRYDPSRGGNFLSFAIPTMTGGVRRHFRDSTWSVKTPRAIKDRFVAVASATAELAQHLNRAPTTGELAQRLALTHNEVVEAIAARSSHRSGPLDEAFTGDDATLVDVLGVVDANFEQVEVRDSVRRLMSSLTHRNRKIVLLNFVHEKTQAEIGVELGISQMHVSRLLRRSLDQLRQEVERQPALGRHS